MRTPEKELTLLSSNQKSSKDGLTLVEIMVVMSISLLLVTGVLSFYIQFLKMGYVNEQRNRINRDIRQLTSELTRVGKQSNDFFIYESIANDARNAPNDRQLDGTSGDLLVFTYNSDSSKNETERIVGYYRASEASDPDALGPVMRFEVHFSPASQLAIEKLIPKVDSLPEPDVVIELSKGLADGRLFYNFLGKSIMLNGQIYHGNDAKRVTETYNYTISPRG